MTTRQQQILEDTGFLSAALDAENAGADYLVDYYIDKAENAINEKYGVTGATLLYNAIDSLNKYETMVQSL